MKAAVMENPGDLEILAEAHSVWEIRNYTKLVHRSHGPEFECGGFKW
jgi:ubiquitin carboxyl-terminal hydrolase 7